MVLNVKMEPILSLKLEVAPAQDMAGLLSGWQAKESSRFTIINNA